MSPGLVAIAAAVAVVALVAWLRRRDGSVRAVGQASASVPAERGAPLAAVVDVLGERATLVQFSSAFCAPCRQTRVLLADLAAVVPGVVHVELDAESHLELVRAMGVLRTPTTFVLDPVGAVRNKATGVPRREDLLAVLAG